MSNKTLRTILICVICVLATVLLALGGLLLTRVIYQSPAVDYPFPDFTLETTLATTQATTVTTETTAETTVETTEPQPIVYTLTFAGDCTLANQRGASDFEGFIGTVGQNYDHPFADVIDYFSNDTATFINLECAFTDYPDAADKRFAFKGPKDYINILTQGSIEFANVANNHSLDYGTQGLKDTTDLLEEHGIAYAKDKTHTVFEVADGLKIGVVAMTDPRGNADVASHIKALKKAGAEIIIASMHWGQEYWYVPNGEQIQLARAAIDAGADIVYGHHPHVLQKIETYKDGIIFFSLGNFSFGGNNNPPDKDTAILQQQFIRYPDGTLEMGELTIIPCYVSGIVYEWGNDYQPMPIPETDEEAYKRVLSKLDGSFPYTNLYVPYRDDLFPTTKPDSTDSTDGTGDGETVDPTEGETSDPTGGETSEPTDNPSEETEPPQDTQPVVDEPEAPPQDTQPVVDNNDPSAGGDGGEDA